MDDDDDDDMNENRCGEDRFDAILLLLKVVVSSLSLVMNANCE